MAMDGRYAGNAGAVADMGQQTIMPAMQEQLPAMANGMAGMPAMQEQLPAMANDQIG
jgi:hypothetical protein